MADDLAALRACCAEHSRGTTVSRVSDGLPDWIVDQGRLRHVTADYFTIGLFAAEAQRPLLLMEQKETALVMLLAANIDGRDAVLLSLRTEPGLIGLTNFSTTIQSTPSNYLRKHGGKATPFVEIAAAPQTFGTVVYDGEQYDWGDFYLHKTKRLLIVKLAAAPEAPAGYLWVDKEVARRLLLEDNFVTNDLRVALSLFLERGGGASPESSVRNDEDGRACPESLPFSPDVVDARGTSIEFFRTHTETREVSSWVQPLVVPRGPLGVSLSCSHGRDGPVFALEKRTQPGLLGREVWFPARSQEGGAMRRVTTSAEGGRFFRHQIDMELREVNPVAGDPAGGPDEAPVWMTRDEVQGLIAEQRRTSLELRLAWSLVVAGAGST